LDPNNTTGHKVDPSEGIDKKTLLQVDASMVVGVLFILTLSGFISGSEITGRFLTGYFTILIIAPFVISAFMILYTTSRGELGELIVAVARGITAAGFLIFGGYLGLITALQTLPTIPPMPFAEDVEQLCAKSPETFNVTADPWKCSKFSGASLAEKCAKNPEFFDATRSDCADFIPPSS
jgi:hypothetical protein